MSDADPRDIVRIVEFGTGDVGRHIRLKIEFADGSFEEFDLAHERAGEFITRVVFGADAALY